MATTTITVESFQMAIAECADAIAAADWTTAATQYAVAEAINAGLDVEGSSGGARSRRRETLEGLSAAIEKAEARVSRGTERSRLVSTQVKHS